MQTAHDPGLEKSKARFDNIGERDEKSSTADTLALLSEEWPDSMTKT